MSSQRSLLIAVIVAVVGVLAVLLIRRGPEPPPAPVAVRPSATPAALAVASPEPTRVPERRVVRTETYFEPVDEGQLTREQAAAAAARYRKAARFPRTSR